MAQWESRNGAHPRLTFYITTELFTLPLRPLMQHNQIKLIQNIMVCHIKSLLKMQDFFPLKLANILQRTPIHLMDFLHRPSTFIKNQIMMWPPNEPRQTNMKEEPTSIKQPQRLIKTHAIK